MSTESDSPSSGDSSSHGGNDVNIDTGSLIRAGKVLAAVVCVILAVMCIAIPLMTAYNQIIDADLQVQRAASNVKTDLERRADLLPNLASTVQGSAEFEYKSQHDIYVEVAQARGAADAARLAGQIHSSDPAAVASTNTAEEVQLTQLLGNFVRLQEQYPDVKLNTVQQFREFSAQVTATENQILVDRQTYNKAVMQYQGIVRSFPTNLVADHYGFSADRYHMYVPVDQERAEEVPVITFDFSAL